jgi:putative DNA primase/helicase
MTAMPLTIEPDPLDVPRPNRAHISQHLYALFAPGFVKDYPDAWIEIAFADMAGDGTPNAAEHFSPFELEKAAAYAEKKNLAGFNLYVGVSLRQGETGPSGRSSGDNFLAAAYTWADSDDAGALVRINGALETHSLPTSMLVMTGRTPHERAHLYFRLDGKATKDQVKNANIALKKMLDTDDVEDVCRVMRLAGTVSYPTEAKRGRGYVPELVTLHIRKNMPCYTVERLTGFAAASKSDSTRPRRTDDDIVTLLDASRIEGKWHNSVREAIASMIGRGWSDLQIRLACAPYCKGGSTDPDLDDLINGARAKWNKPEDESASSAEIEIARLAKLPAIKYEQERKAAAESLGLRTSILDRLVQGERDRLGLDDDETGMQGRAISFPDPEPWPQPVDGAAMFDEIAKAIGSHVIMPEASQDACALWAAHTFLTDATMISPRLAITSPTRGCGKTTALDVISQLVLRPLAAANVSASAIFRVVEGFRPTLMIDEADSFLRDNEELRGVLNSGHRKGGAVLRNVGDDHEPRSFSTYSACAIALIGQLPGTLTDRSVPITLTRRKRDEAITPFRLDKVDHLVVLARKLARWTTDNAVAIAATEPEMPAGIYNRAADNWRPLLAIATVAGGKWRDRGERAALKSVAADIDDASRLELLLGDIRDIFAKRAANNIEPAKEIPSADLVSGLVGLEGRPWAEYGKNDKPVTANGLARLLKQVGIAPEQIGPEGSRVRGYKLHLFQDAFDRYLPSEGCSQPSSRSEPDEIRVSDVLEPSSPNNGWTDEKREKPNNDGPLDGWTAEKGGQGEEHDIPDDRTCAQCHGDIDGSERLVSVSGQAVWLHLECERFWVRALNGQGR